MVRLRDEDVNQTSLKYYRVRGLKHVVLKTVSGDQLVMLMIPLPCPHLTKDNLCDCYANRPEICRKYDGAKDPTCECKKKEGAG
jgi:Fe-S-cluster containining protein